MTDVFESEDVLFWNVEHLDAQLHILIVVPHSREVFHELSVPILLVAEDKSKLVCEFVLLLILAWLFNFFFDLLEFSIILIQEVKDSFFFHLLLFLILPGLFL